MNYINNLGEFGSLADVWKEYPHGGKEGDYVVINGVNVAWNKYTTNWGADTGMPDVNNEVNGDFLVKRDLRVGGEIINKDLKWIKEATVLNKGYFKTVDDLKRSYPAATAGSKAYVGSDYPYAIYLWDGKNAAWVDSGEYFDDSLRNKGYFATVEALQAAYPLASAGAKAYVGATYPFAIYLWDATTSAWVDSGETGGEESVNLGDYYTKEETDAKVTELESRVGLEVYFAAGNVPTFSANNDSLDIVLPGTELRIYDKSGILKYTIDKYKDIKFSIPAASQLVYFVQTKDLSVIPLSENGDYIKLLSVKNTSSSKVVDGLLSSFFTEYRFKDNDNVENLKQSTTIYLPAQNRDSLYLEEHINSGNVYLNAPSLVVRYKSTTKSYMMSNLAEELGISLVTSTKGVENCIAIPNISKFCFNALTGKFEIIDRDSARKEHILLVESSSGEIIYVNQNLFNVYDIRPSVDDLKYEIEKIGIGFTPTNGKLPNINTTDKVLDLGEDAVLYIGNKYFAFKEIFPNNTEYYRAIPFYEDGNNTGATKLTFNIESKRILTKGVATPLSKDDVVIGAFRLAYQTHNFISANLPFDYTIDGKTLAQIETSKKQVNYIGERPNLPMRSEFRDLFSISTSAFVLSTQGMDIYANKYLFQGSNEPSESVNYNNIVVVDMDSKKVIGGLEFKKESHLNTINCGLKFAESDTYPLLYVSECYYEHKCEVVRLANDLASYQVIQKIAYNGSHFEGWSAYDWTIDLGNSYIYAFGTNNGFTQILKFSLPLPSGDVMLTDSDILDVIEFNGAYVYQGAKVINNQMYIPFGFDTSEYPAFLKVVDIERKMVVSHIPLDGIGEPEAVALYNNNLVIVNHANKPTYTEIIL